MDYSGDPKVLDRSRARRDAQPLADLARPLLANLVNFGSNLIGHTRSSPKATTDAEFPILASFLHLVEMCDAVEVLLEEGSAWPCIPLLRSMFEALLTSEYIAQADSEQRSASWWVGYLVSSKRMLKGQDHRTAEGKQFLRIVRDDKNLTGWERLDPKSYDRFYRSHDEMLSHPRYRDAAREYEAVRGRSGRNPPWHNLYGGPANLRDLAVRLKRGAQYEVLYRQWSDIVHPQNLGRWMRKDSGFPPIVTAIRDQRLSPDVAFNAANIILESLEVVGSFFELDESVFRPDSSLLSGWVKLKEWTIREGIAATRSN